MSFDFVLSKNRFNECHYQHNVSLVSSLESISETELMPLTEGRTFYVSRPWLLAIERLRGGGTTYVVSRDKVGRLLGVLPIYGCEPSTRGFYEPYNRFLARSGGIFNRNDWSPALIIGSRAAYSCEFLVANFLDAKEKAYVLTSMIEVAKDYAKECGAASISALYINECGRKQLEEVITEDTNFFVAGANAILDIRWNNFEDYLASMKGSNRREIRREIRVFSSQGYRILSRKLADSIDTLAELFAHHERKYGHNTSPQSEAKELRTLADTANDYSHVLILEHAGRPIGGILLFLWEDTVYARSVGIGVKGNAFEYFNLTYYEIIRFAIENGYHHIDYGMATYRAKLSRGARLEPLWGLIHSKSASSPFLDSKFVAWNRLRQEAINLSDATLLERRQIP